MAKYTLLKNKVTGARSVRINPTGEIIRELENPELYLKLRRQAVANYRKAERDQVMRDCGLVKVRGALGGVYWE